MRDFCSRVEPGITCSGCKPSARAVGNLPLIVDRYPSINWTRSGVGLDPLCSFLDHAIFAGSARPNCRLNPHAKGLTNLPPSHRDLPIELDVDFAGLESDRKVQH
jgi:hypothetical protein